MEPEIFLAQFAASGKTAVDFAKEIKITKGKLENHVRLAREGRYGPSLQTTFMKRKSLLRDLDKALVEAFAVACAADAKMTPGKFASLKDIKTSKVSAVIKSARKGVYGAEHQLLVPFKAPLYLDRNKTSDAVDALLALGGSRD